VTLPPAWKKLDNVAESVTDCPTVIVAEDGVVVMLGFAFWTLKGSQGEIAALLAGSPL
jgi:hypothetical protein